MSETERMFVAMYDAFNRRDPDACLAYMSEDVTWPKASEGGLVSGRDEIRAYWQRQWAEFDPTVTPTSICQTPDGADVTVHQVVRTRGGEILFNGTVLHRYSLSAEGRITSMRIGDGAIAETASAAFRRS